MRHPHVTLIPPSDPQLLDARVFGRIGRKVAIKLRECVRTKDTFVYPCTISGPGDNDDEVNAHVTLFVRDGHFPVEAGIQLGKTDHSVLPTIATLESFSVIL